MEPVMSGAARQLTATGRSAIAVIRLTGDLSPLDSPTSLFRAANRQRVVEQSVDAICFGVWGDPGEEVVLCRTGVDSVEVTCHGGAAAVARILEDAQSRGFGIEVSQSGVFCSEKARPFAERKATLSSAEDALVLTQARTQRTAEILLEQSSVWPQFIAGLSQRPHEEALAVIDEALAWSEFGRHLTQPWNVVLCGRPNVGKSSLMNALAGFTRSIVSAQAGTTRDRVTLETAINGWPVRITDTAGVRETSDAIEQAGVEQTHSALDQADLAVIVLDASEPLQDADRQLLRADASPSVVFRSAKEQPFAERKATLVVAHKSDLPRTADADRPPDCLEVSSVTGQGVEALLLAISTALIPALPPSGQPIPVSSQQETQLRMLRTKLTPPSPPEPRHAHPTPDPDRPLHL